MMQALVQLTSIAARQDEYLRRRQDAERDSRFRIQRIIPKVSAENGQKLLEDIMAFEEAFLKTNPSTSKEWALAFDEALVDRAKHWRDFIILTDPGRNFYERMVRVNGTEDDHANYYRYIRTCLLYTSDAADE